MAVPFRKVGNHLARKGFLVPSIRPLSFFFSTSSQPDHYQFFLLAGEVCLHN